MSAAPVVANGRKEYKDEQLLARLIGAAVLLAIAVIVLPFVLDGSGSQREYEYAETFPVQPERPLVEKSYSSRQPLPDAPSVDDVPVVTIAEPPVLAVELPVKSESGDPGIPPQNPAVSVSQKVTQGSDDRRVGAPVVASDKPTKAPVVAAANQEIPLGFNIQVASFVKDSNALSLLGRLRQENLPAYVNRVDGKKRVIFRVFVGPLSSQIDALALKNRIDRTYRVDSIMVTRN